MWSFGKLREISNLHSHLSHIIHDHPVCYFGNHKSLKEKITKNTAAIMIETIMVPVADV